MRSAFPAARFFASSGPAIAESPSAGRRKGKNHMNPLIQLKTATPLSLVVLLLACFALAQSAHAPQSAPRRKAMARLPMVWGNHRQFKDSPPFFSLTSGTYNTAVGWLSLVFRLPTTGKFNTRRGWRPGTTPNVNTADRNTATGAGAFKQFHGHRKHGQWSVRALLTTTPTS